MSGVPVRVAVQEGAETVRVAAAAVDGPPWLVAELPAPGPGIPVLLAELVGPAPDELLLLHPARWPDRRAREWAQQHAGLAARVRAVPAPLAAAGRGGVAVLDVGAAGAEATLLATDGGIRACVTADVGGRTLDALLTARRARAAGSAREAREALSLLPVVDGITADELDAVLAGPLGAAVDALRAVLVDAPAVPVLLVGGVARSPLLARLVDAAGVAGAVVAPRPDAAAVLGALAHPAEGRDRPHEVVAGTGATARPDERDPECGEEPGAAHDPQAPAPVGRLLPPLPPRRRRPLRTALRAVAALAAVVLLLAAGRALAAPGGGEVPAGVLVQYGYRLDVPAGWEHTGGLPERRRVLLTPVGAPEGSDLIAVERSPLGYDAAAEPERARDELRAVFDTAVAHGSPLSGYDPDARFAGRAVASYRQDDGRTVVDWFVVLDGDAQLSVGCRHTAAGAAAVAAACAVVVGSVRGS
jgi:type VII secretion-associated protein (TIGR03931 family)